MSKVSKVCKAGGHLSCLSLVTLLTLAHTLWSARPHAPHSTSALTLTRHPRAQDFVGRTLTQVAAACSFAEPYLGAGAGYVQVTRATGLGPVLLLIPSNGTEIEAWRPLVRHAPSPYAVMAARLGRMF